MAKVVLSRKGFDASAGAAQTILARAGALPHHRRRVLTAPDARSPADWLLPACVREATLLPRHRSPVRQDGRFDARYQWQEFVADGGEELSAWAEGLLHEGA